MLIPYINNFTCCNSGLEVPIKSREVITFENWMVGTWGNVRSTKTEVESIQCAYGFGEKFSLLTNSLEW